MTIIRNNDNKKSNDNANSNNKERTMTIKK